MKLQDLLDFYGSEIMIAAKLGFSHQSIKNWKEEGVIPESSQCVIQVKTNGKFVADVDIGEY